MNEALKKALEQLDSKILTESFQTTISEVFDAEVDKKMELKATELKESFDTNIDAVITSKLTELKESFKEQVEDRAKELNESQNTKLVESVDTYLEEVKDKWLKENQVALQEEADVLKAEKILEAFNSFATDFAIDLHGITSVDMDAKKLLDESVTDKAELKKEVLELKKEKVITEACEGLTVEKAESLKTLTESITTNDLDKFAEQLKTFKETLVEGVTLKEKSKKKTDSKLQYS